MIIGNKLAFARYVDTVCDKFESRWQADQPTNFEPYVGLIKCATLRTKLLKDLVQIDVELAFRAGRDIDENRYRRVHSEAVEWANTALKEQQKQSTHFPAPSGLEETHSHFPDDSRQKTQLGPYRLLHRLGEGGMGVVWMAEQRFPARRRVALKVIKAGIHSRQVVSRFNAECQLLAMMNHPNIARLIDADSEEGQPYFVMELVPGIPVTEYCDRNRLSLAERLQLFVVICNAVEYAHQTGVIHRDLKPSNVLVTLQDGAVIPKIIDFGLAKTMRQLSEFADRSCVTEAGQIIGTPKYMSPEQLVADSDNIDARSDVYSLGVLLCELLTGSTPFCRQLLNNRGVIHTLQTISKTEPLRPSLLLNESKDLTRKISERMQIEPRKLKQILRSDLDWIVIKALERDRKCRYASAQELGKDLLRHLMRQPIVARPPSIRYRLRKSLRQHRISIVAVFLSLLLMTIGILFGTLLGFNAASADRWQNESKLDRNHEQYVSTSIVQDIRGTN